MSDLRGPDFPKPQDSSLPTIFYLEFAAGWGLKMSILPKS